MISKSYYIYEWVWKLMFFTATVLPHSILSPVPLIPPYLQIVISKESRGGMYPNFLLLLDIYFIEEL